MSRKVFSGNLRDGRYVSLAPRLFTTEGPRRESDSAPTTPLNHTTPPSTGAAHPEAAAPVTENTRMRPCRACRRPAPEHEFLLLNDPAARAQGYRTRLWCGECLVAKGHVRAPRLAAARAAHAERLRVIAETTRSWQLTLQLLDRSANDPAVREAVLCAADWLTLDRRAVS